jgi:putative two-component system response regulator
MSADRCTILVVDDDPVNIRLINASLRDDYSIRAATSGEAALKATLVQPLPDLAILGIMMPEMDGYELCLRLKSEALTREIPVIFLTAMSQVEDEARGFRVGAVDYIHKPISPPVLQERVRTHLALKNARDMLRKQNEVLEDLVKQRTVQLA